jgi:type IV pilus assembly protein PilW
MLVKQECQLGFRQQGLSIVEIMIALVLGALLTLGLVQIFTANSQSFRVNEASARAQESGRISSDILARSIRNAGYYGCFPVNGIKNNLDTTDNDYDETLHEFRPEGIFSNDTDAPTIADIDSDWFVVSGLRSGGVSLRSVGQINSASFTVNQRGDLARGDVIMVSDCNNGDIFEISNIQQGGGSTADVTVVANSGDGEPGNDFSANSPAGCNNANNCLSALYPDGAQVLRPYNETYFIAQGSSGTNSLFFIDSTSNSAQPIELVSGVERMRARYAIGDTSNFVDASGVGNWDNVVAVQIALLVRSGANNILETPRSMCFPWWEQDGECSVSDNFTAGDNALYRDYSFTTALRNRR